MTRGTPRGMKIGAVPLWLLLLLSERPMYGYEILRELERRFSGYWKPKTGTIYPALERLEHEGLVTSRLEFRDQGLDRKHYALTAKGKAELGQTMAHWTKMMGVLETYREMHESIFRYKDQLGRAELSRLLASIGKALAKGTLDVSRLMPSKKRVSIRPTEPVDFKFLYAKEGEELEIHMEIEWSPEAVEGRRRGRARGPNRPSP